MNKPKTPATFVLIPGAGGVAQYWSRLGPLLEAEGHEVIAVDLPGDSEIEGLAAYADIVVRAIGERKGVVLVAQSMGGFTAPAVCARVPVKMVVLVNAMIPMPGETPGAWWGNTNSAAARIAAAKRGGYSTEFEMFQYFLHDVPADVIKAGEKNQRQEAPVAFAEPALFKAWPTIPIHVVASKGDRFFPLGFQIEIAKKRLGETVDEIDGGHLVALSNPEDLARLLLGYLNQRG